jgi:hypothetical protein
MLYHFLEQAIVQKVEQATARSHRWLPLQGPESGARRM